MTERPAPKIWPDRLILFDGVCVMCSGSVRQVIARDRTRRFSFASIQSPYGRALATAAGINPDEPHSNAVAIDGKLLLKSDAALSIAGELEGLRWLGGLKRAPRPLRDWFYERVARNRYAIFGKSETCFLPAPEDRARFLDDAPPPTAAP